jgi:hypothetical protein
VTTGAFLLLAIGGILFLGGWVMLLVLGFKKGIGWGIAILFLSWLIVPVVAFAAKHWGEAKTGFFLMLAGVIAGGIGFVAVVGSTATSAMAEFESFDLTQPEAVVEQPVGPSPDEEEPPIATGEEPGLALVEEPPEEALPYATPTPVPQPTPAGTVLGERVEWKPLLDSASLPAYRGELIELHMRDGTVLRVTLDDIQGDTLLVTQRVGGGSLGYRVKRNLIAEIHIMK